jgi:hypothetical protein
MYGMYGKNIIGAGPGGSSFGSIQANTANPYTAALGGAMAGFGAGGNIMDYFGGGAKGYMGQDGYRSFNPTPTVPVSSYY